MKCKLCLDNSANQENSHIISKFLCEKRLKEGHKNMININLNSGKAKRSQAIPKEDYIFCSDCEKYLGILERIVSNKIILKPNELPLKGNLYLEIGEGNFNYIYNLFIYSLVWRASISNSFNVKCLPKDEEYLRDFLILNKNLKEKEVKNGNYCFNMNMFKHYILVPDPSLKSETPRAGLMLKQLNERAFSFFMGDYYLYFQFGNEELDPILENYNNSTNERKIRVVLHEPEIYSEFWINEFSNETN